ncbi:hypothetical protein PIB30_088984 [Stylosanthes scabra]|uniref:Uncharacterized protein n=1 Tax=Stylosanthes scabra TaxID=79078 RepID=A0ABU6VSB1_9FABA|nr:hypothetical protein [Stylosanthes scabra]
MGVIPSAARITQDVGTELEEQEDIMIMCQAKPRNYSPPYETTLRGGGVFNPRNPSPVTQYHAQGWHSPPLQGGSYGYSNNPQPPFDPFRTGVGGYNPPIFGTFP